MSFPRWTAVLPVVALAAAVPIVMAARDPVESERERMASMTPAQRKVIERNRQAYDKLSSLEKYELEQLRAALANLDPKERDELDATMNRLAAVVETLPDSAREKYFDGLASTRQTILKQQLAARREQSPTIAGRVDEAAKMHEKSIASFPPRLKQRNKPFENFLNRLVQQKGSAEDKKLSDLYLYSNGLTEKDRMLVRWVIAARLESAGVRTNLPIDTAGADLVANTFRKLKFVPALQEFSFWKPLDEEDRRYVAKVVGQIYLLAPNPRITVDDALRTFDLKASGGTPFAEHPTYLLRQLALLKEYGCGKEAPPKQDEAAVMDLLGKSR